MNPRKILCAAAGAFALGVCGFTLFLSSKAGTCVLILNLAVLFCLLLTAGLALAFGLGKMARMEEALRRAGASMQAAPDQFLPEQAAKEDSLFSQPFLDSRYGAYASFLSKNPESACDLKEFLNEKNLKGYSGVRLLKAVSPLLLGIGLLGGLLSFCPVFSLGGSAFALLPVLSGLALFLAYALSLAVYQEDLENALEAFLQAHSLLVRPSYKTDSLNRLLSVYRTREETVQDLTEIFVAQMGKSFEQAVTPSFEQAKEGIRQITDTFRDSQEALLTRSCETVIRHMRQELAADFARIDKLIDHLTKTQSSYGESIERTLSRLEKVSAALQENVERADAFHSQALRDLNAAQRETVRAEEVQKEAYQEYIRFMYESIQRFSQVWEKYTEEFQRCADEISRMTPVRASREEKERLARISSLLHDLQNQQIAANRSAVSSADFAEQKALLSETIRRLDELTELAQKPFFFLGHRKNREEA